MRLIFENVGAGHPLYFSYQNSAASQFSIHDSNFTDQYHVLISVTTGKESSLFFIAFDVHNIIIRPSRLWVWFHECREDAASTGTGQCNCCKKTFFQGDVNKSPQISGSHVMG